MLVNPVGATEPYLVGKFRRLSPVSSGNGIAPFGGKRSSRLQPF